MTQLFHPEDFNFLKLDLQLESLCFYEYCSGDFCDGKMDPHRINIYLTQDGEFITVWHGLFDPLFIDQSFYDLVKNAGLEDFDFSASYNTSLFRGYIETKAQAEVILPALRLETFRPQFLRIDEKYGLTCESLTVSAGIARGLEDVAAGRYVEMTPEYIEEFLAKMKK